jgi:hypothetical protein
MLLGLVFRFRYSSVLANCLHRWGTDHGMRPCLSWKRHRVPVRKRARRAFYEIMQYSQPARSYRLLKVVVISPSFQGDTPYADNA